MTDDTGRATRGTTTGDDDAAASDSRSTVDRIREGERPSDAGGYIGREPELAAETIPGGVQPDDERIAGTATQSGGEGGAGRQIQDDRWPEGHREAERDSGLRREAGQDR